MTLLCGGPIKRCTQWSERTLAKAFDLRLNCGDRAYKYLLEQGYPLPSIKTMQRHIRNVEIKLQHPGNWLNHCFFDLLRSKAPFRT